MNSPEEFSDLNDADLYRLAKRLISESFYGNRDIGLKLESVKTECLKRDIEMFGDAIEDTMIFITGRSLLAEGISIASVERGKYLNDAIYKLYANPYPERKVTTNDAYRAVGIAKHNILICSVSGDSMIESGIRDGVKAIADKSLAPADGNIIIARVYGSLFIKRFRLIGGQVWLYSENADFPPVLIIPGMDFKSLGVVMYYIDNLNYEEN